METTNRIKAILDQSKERVQELANFELECVEADRRGDPHRFDGLYKLFLEEASTCPKKMRIEVELMYPHGDIYPAMRTMNLLIERFGEWLNANLCDGDMRLRMTKISVDADGLRITRE